MQLKMNHLTNFTIIAALAVSSTAHASTVASTFMKRENRLGCATIQSVRNLNQTPLYDFEYERSVSGSGGSAELAIAAVGLGLLNAATAGVASLVVDAVRDPSKPQPGVKPPADGVWRHVKAVQIKMDDGAVMNLPLVAPHGSLAPSYEAGSRVRVFWLPERDSLQLTLTGRMPLPEDKTYNAWCLRAVPQDRAQEIFKAAASLVKEELIKP
jgi:hypothetical protein